MIQECLCNGKNNVLILNEDKCKLLMLSKQEVRREMCLGIITITNSNSEKLLGINIDHKLKFDEYVNNLCNKADQKLHARISNYISKDGLRSIMKAFITSQFGYCPMILMFHSRKLNPIWFKVF